MFIGIDGTRLWNFPKYTLEMGGSFINQLTRAAVKNNNDIYIEGPTIAGNEDMVILESAVAAIKGFVEMGDTEINLAGYSRGGAIAIRAAKRIQESSWGRGLKVGTLLLFDAVERDIFLGGSAIPGNVNLCFHAIRNPAIGSRASFGNCGTSMEGEGKLTKRIFNATHSAMGGMPWGGDHPMSIVFTTRNSSDPLGCYALLSRGTRSNKGQIARPIPDWKPTITESQDRGGSSRVRGWMWKMAMESGVI